MWWKHVLEGARTWQLVFGVIQHEIIHTPPPPHTLCSIYAMCIDSVWQKYSLILAYSYVFMLHKWLSDCTIANDLRYLHHPRQSNKTDLDQLPWFVTTAHVYSVTARGLGQDSSCCLGRGASGPARCENVVFSHKSICIPSKGYFNYPLQKSRESVPLYGEIRCANVVLLVTMNDGI